MGAAIEVFEGARTIEVGRDRFVPVKTTNDLLVLRSDVYDIGEDFVLDQVADALPVRRPRRGVLQARRRLRQALPRGRAVAARGDLAARSTATGPSARGVKVVGDVDAWRRPRPSGSRPVASWSMTADRELVSVEEHLDRILAADRRRCRPSTSR